MVKFREYLRSAGMTNKDAAKILGISRLHFQSLLWGRRLPSLKLAIKIEKFTEGIIKPSDWSKHD